MNIEFFYFLFFAFLMGLRHGLDPDHLAIINGITLQETNINTSKWNGFMFSMGHGMTVTLVGVAIASLANFDLFPTQIFTYAEWIPIVLLLFTGFYNAYILWVNSTENHTHWKLKFLDSNKPISLLRMFMVGFIFALVFDTASQTAAWTLAAQQDSKIEAALLTGLIFTFGMVITDTGNGILFSKAYHQKQSKETAIKLQKSLGWIVAISSILLGTHQLLEKIKIEIPVSDTFKTLLGLGIVLFTMVVRFYPKKIVKN